MGSTCPAGLSSRSVTPPVGGEMDQQEMEAVIQGVVRQVVGALDDRVDDLSEAKQLIDRLPDYSHAETDKQMMSMIQGVVRQVVAILPLVEYRTNVGEFLGTLPGCHYVEGESLVTDMLMTMARCLVFKDLVDLVSSVASSSTLARLRGTLELFISEKVLKSGSKATTGSIQQALSLIAADWYSQVVR